MKKTNEEEKWLLKEKNFSLLYDMCLLDIFSGS